MNDYGELLIKSIPELDLKQMGYKSPITIFQDELTRQIIADTETGIFKAVYEQGIVVDKEELIKALAYDREQYQKGFQDGLDVGRGWVVEICQRIVEKFQMLTERHMALSENAGEKGFEKHMILEGGKGIAFEVAIEIVKEEGGLND